MNTCNVRLVEQPPVPHNCGGAKYVHSASVVPGRFTWRDPQKSQYGYICVITRAGDIARAGCDNRSANLACKILYTVRKASWSNGEISINEVSI
jgi:hypothetical protein